MSETLIKVECISKKFCKSLKKSLFYGMQDLGREITGRRHGGNGELRFDEFWAVKDVSFELKRGECLGLIGRNGAGKTTLLRMLNGLIKPDAGRIEMRGRIGALIALGAGFNPILTGRENIYVNASVLGLSKQEIEEKIDEIIDFAEIGEFIDMPVQSYSSGMSVRLGFAVASTLQPDILLLDEILAVGDASFRHKCYHKINKVIAKSAVIIVSHSMDQIAAVAKSVGLLNRGSFRLYNNIVDGIDAYNMQTAGSEDDVDGGTVLAVYPPIIDAQLTITEDRIFYGGILHVIIDLNCSDTIENLTISFTGVNGNSQSVMNWNNRYLPEAINLPKGKSTLSFTVSPLLLHQGRYSCNLWIGRKKNIEALLYAMRAAFFIVESTYPPLSDIPYLPDPSGLQLVTENSVKVFKAVIDTNPYVVSAQNKFTIN